MEYCTDCGAPLRVGHRFCPRCGHAVSFPIPPTQSALPPVGSHRFWLILATLLVAAGIVGYLGPSWWGRTTGQTTQLETDDSNSASASGSSTTPPARATAGLQNAAVVGGTPPQAAVDSSSAKPRVAPDERASGQRAQPSDLLILLESCEAQRERCTPERVKGFIERGADVNYDGGRPLVAAISYGLPLEIVQLLIEGGADVNRQWKDGTTSLFALADRWYDTGPYLRVLLKAGANPNVREKRYGGTALIKAVGAGRLEFVRTLLEAGADPSIRLNANVTFPDGTSLYGLCASCPDSGICGNCPGDTALSVAERALVSAQGFESKARAGAKADASQVAQLERAISRVQEATNIVQLLREAVGPRRASVSASASPQLPYVLENVVLYRYVGEQMADSRMPVYRTRGEKSVATFTLEPDEIFNVVRGDIVTRRTGVIQVLQSLEAEITWTSPAGSGGGTLPFKPGDTIVTLAGLGEGCYAIWRSDRRVDACNLGGANVRGPLTRDSPAPEQELWVLIRDRKGRLGWIMR